jgi:hypothetical protein
MFVYVRNADGAAVMPCSPAKARKLLTAEKAKILEYRPARLNDPTLRGKTTHLYADLRSIAPVSTVYGYETATYRKYRQLPKGKGRVRYQVNSELQGFRKGDLVNVYATIKINCYVKYTCDHFLH